MRGQGNSDESVDGGQLRAFIERVERMQEERKAISDDIAEIYAEAKGNGFDTKVMRNIVRIRAQDHNERMEQEAILELYMAALGMQAPRAHARAREIIDEFGDDDRTADADDHPAPHEHEPAEHPAADTAEVSPQPAPSAEQSTAALMEVPNVEADTFPPERTHPEVVNRQDRGGRDAAEAGTQARPVDTEGISA